MFCVEENVTKTFVRKTTGKLKFSKTSVMLDSSFNLIISLKVTLQMHLLIKFLKEDTIYAFELQFIFMDYNLFL